MKTRMMSKLFMFAVLAAALTLSGTALAQDTIKIGVAGAHSGDLASYGISALRGAEFAVDKVNAAGGIDGKKVEIVKGDEQCKPELATNVATKMVADGITVVMGHICSGATKAALGIYKDAKVITISPSATNPPLTQSGDYPNFYRTIASDDAPGQAGSGLCQEQGFHQTCGPARQGRLWQGFGRVCQELHRG